MKIQRRTFLGGLLAAIAASSVGRGPSLISQAQAVEVEERIRTIMPEPEEGYRLLVTPGYGMAPFKVASVSPVFNDVPEVPSFHIHMERKSFLSNSWDGSITPVEYPVYQSCTLKATLEDRSILTVHDWMHKMRHAVSFDFNQPQASDYKGMATFGKIGDKPMLELNGLFPESYDTRFENDKHVADVVFRFDYASQNIL